MKEDSKIYIAGHTGFVGSAILRNLERRGYKNVVVRTHKELDLMHQESVKKFLEEEKPDYVVLSAAKVGGIQANISNPVDFLMDNLIIEYNVIKNSFEVGIENLLFLGSSCIYPKEAPQPLKEEYLLSGYLEPTNEGYAIAKISGLKMCEYYSKQYGLNYISAMPSNLYGMRDNFDLKTSHVMAALIRRFHEAKVSGSQEISIWGSGEQYREFTYIEDLADGIIFLMEHGEKVKGFLNIGCGKDIKIKDLAYKIKDVVGFKGNIIFDKSKPDGMFRKVMDVSKINSLGWHYKVELDEGITKTYRWYLNNC
ncbi:GDP-L-fucose synthase [Clostridium acetobutylicum]|uniref:GDP-L-fucose synthase n=1 Tax=Clostridium acetobutylicum (strain ATCC 824 / DSM 792 / JCM 1419 / IAM 19013 / LMG 5710 / NBRC 13948 / NRRL B-527 / VKM B-1787 / 2291 / W) TaxID=272562 RepID=Q97H34_CLOAB|nr:MULTISPECIES: GDP-L-fucose synthase [Clostridium]AAK80137.1 Nucleoside-diphosphate-sugar epimerase [Clostridium acetobutylicum ATCC 824]ADZ21230.1 Nucleoside-diphosphate-sugar epimerase [Clostridium acetobutylicum EA 2018]AEI33108.1 nucleoside-diphosphate-sugar epimerase [Clostridium acetobutylicum DSM 1731]AWV79438.1 GDP-L-fucose synthase [Clostridium acetobutylicum]MBC2394591.1 GDP-L-fucose synthase [Clostridium acetobutylicum]